MKFKCEQTELIKAINIVSKGITARTTVPILKGIKLECNREEQKAIFTATDLEIYIEARIDAICEEAGEIVISAKLFSDIIRKLNKGDVFFELKEADMVVISNGDFVSKLQGLSTEEFPKIEKENNGQENTINKELLKDMIKGVCFAASIEEARGIITGVLTEIEENEITMVALDGFRMAIRKEKTEETNKEGKITISGRIMNEIGKILAETGGEDEEEKINLSIEENRAYIETENIKISARLMSGDFIKYKDIIPQESLIQIELERKELLDCVERASIIVKDGKNAFVRMKADEDSRMVITSRADEGTTKEEINIIKEGESIEIGFNGRFITETLKAIEDDKIKILLNTNISPCLIRPTKGDKFEYMVLPVRLDI